jgi:predicted phosphodiesterase
MADSHGRPDTITAASEYLKLRGCTALVHLGDICDSLCPETARACVDIIQSQEIIALKGNNDHSLAGSLATRKGPAALSAVAEFLRSLPIVYRHANAIFTHSRPFFEELGPVSLIGTMDIDAVQQFFDKAPAAILFRGHAHTPGIVWLASQDVVAQPMAAHVSIDLASRIPCVVTCGALTHGYCMTWYPQEGRLVCHCFTGSDPQPS